MIAAIGTPQNHCCRLWVRGVLWNSLEQHGTADKHIFELLTEDGIQEWSIYSELFAPFDSDHN